MGPKLSIEPTQKTLIRLGTHVILLALLCSGSITFLCVSVLEYPSIRRE